MRTRIFICMAFLLCIALSSVKAQQLKTCAAETHPTVTAIKKQPMSEQAISSVQENEHPYGGTFQFISKKDQPQEHFTTDILQYIESKREEDKEVILSLSENTKVKILSRKEVSAPGFKPIKNLYSFE